MKRGLRKFVLTAHITFAVSWLGAVAGFLALALAGVTSQDSQIGRSAFIAMELITRFIILPLSVAPLITGPILSLGTPWGLFRHYWIIVKLLITSLSTLILLAHLRPISYLSDAAAEGRLSIADRGLEIQMIFASAFALLALILVTALAVYKPPGVTAFGRRKQPKQKNVAKVWKFP